MKTYCIYSHARQEFFPPSLNLVLTYVRSS